jgi:hypothetical protein
LDFLKTAVDGPRRARASSQVDAGRCDDFEISDLKRQFNGAESRRFYSLSGLQFPHRRTANAADVSSIVKAMVTLFVISPALLGI